MELDFEGVADAALRAASTLLPQWVGGKRVGNEWVGERRANGGPGDSWSINLQTGVWSHFASGANGHDIIGFYAQLHHLAQGAALRQIADQLGMNDRHVPVLRPYATESTKQPEAVCEPIPPDAPELRNHPTFGAATSIYRYGNAFWVTRYDTPEGKTFSQWTWRNGRWVNRGYGANRPLFHVEQIARHLDAKVLVVEGEKCVETSQPLLRPYVVVTWAGGAAAWRQTDWSSLKGREVHIWPDADEVGRQAAADISAHLVGIASSVSVINPNGAEPGWDIADAINKDGWDGNRICDFAKEHIEERIKSATKLDLPKNEAISTQSPSVIDLHLEKEQTSAIVTWTQLGLACGNNGIPHTTLANASLVLQSHPRFSGKIWLDEFRGVIFHCLNGPQDRWTDDDTLAAAVFVQQSLDLPKMTPTLIHDAVVHAARRYRRNSLRDWLKTLQWDGMGRLDTWLTDTLGIEQTDYTRAISRNWPIAMVARAYQPGCKVDNMPVLEGKSGLNKTQFLEVLGGEWYKALPHQFGDKDFLQAIQGAWLVEIPDMTGFSRRDHGHVIATLTVRNDIYRKSYGRITEEHPRVAIFAATSETDDYLSDTRGHRRYWPLRCKDINLDTLRSQRDQIFAEAITCYRNGDKWYVMPSSAQDEQMSRASSDLWTDDIIAYANHFWESNRTSQVRSYLTSKILLTQVIGLELSKQTDGEKKRIARIMQSNGWIPKNDRNGRWWKKRDLED